MFLEYGLNKHDELIHIGEAARGLNDLYCPYCGGQLLAKKGNEKIHHFAHAGETCQEIGDRGDDAFKLPFYDKFDLGLSPKEIKLLHDFHNDSGGYMAYNERDSRNSLKTRGFIHHNSFAGRGGAWELTHLGKIPVGQATLTKFSEIQLERQIEKHEDFERKIYKDWKFKGETKSFLMKGTPKAQLWDRGNGQGFLINKNLTPTWYEPTPNALENGLADLNIYRAQMRRVLSASLYFLEISVKGSDPIYKIGVTSRSIEERIAEIRLALNPLIGQAIIKPLKVLAHRGGAEFYFKYRFKEYRHNLGNLTEYFAFDKRQKSNTLRELSILGEYEPDEFLWSIIRGEKSAIEQAIENEVIEQQRAAAAQLYKESHQRATKEGMQRAASEGIHIGRPKTADEELLSKYEQLAPLLSQGRAIRDIVRETGIARNTIRKIKRILDGKQ